MINPPIVGPIVFSASRMMTAKIDGFGTSGWSAIVRAVGDAGSGGFRSGVSLSLSASHFSRKVSSFDGVTSIPVRNPPTVAAPATIHGYCRVHSLRFAPSASACFMSAMTAVIAARASSAWRVV